VGSVLFDRLLFLRLNRLFTLLRVVGRSPVLVVGRSLGVSSPYTAILSGSAVNGKEDIIGGSLSIKDGDCDPSASAWLDWLLSIAKYLG
jgi:hypothetical protein